jgi:hypothetical protein
MVYFLEISLILWVCPLVDCLFIKGAAYLVLYLDATLSYFVLSGISMTPIICFMRFTNVKLSSSLKLV